MKGYLQYIGDFFFKMVRWQKREQDNLVRFLLFDVSMVDSPREEGYFILSVKRDCLFFRIILRLFTKK
ncbi:hypothetical protein H206_01658 [Candidatus Electrothrix aarhusensis]|jgi:hypothetical protein|uniref:Uncharacterized protein n=1 Tax=Candidatus Electrothrix aarhusensis TaxID=1859131 RepID=A0A444IU99_9BACT|nr:hypothetical protein H206_01658 [Candidatus Electrothrix aarhusensis]